LRGTAATKFYIAGLPIRVIAEILAWSEDQVERIIRRYVARAAATKEAIRRLNAAGNNKVKPCRIISHRFVTSNIVGAKLISFSFLRGFKFQNEWANLFRQSIGFTILCCPKSEISRNFSSRHFHNFEIRRRSRH
jgi:hypothetical protein